MDISQIPFNHLIGLEAAHPEEGLVSLPAAVKYHNHLGTLHGSALIAVAEAGSGEFLLRQLGAQPDFIPVVRRVVAKFSRPASGRVVSRCMLPTQTTQAWAEELTNRGHLLIRLPMEVIDNNGTVVLRASFDWYVSRKSAPNER